MSMTTRLVTNKRNIFFTALLAGLGHAAGEDPLDSATWPACPAETSTVCPD